jgi:hypothetical protein
LDACDIISSQVLQFHEFSQPGDPKKKEGGLANPIKGFFRFKKRKNRHILTKKNLRNRQI